MSKDKHNSTEQMRRKIVGLYSSLLDTAFKGIEDSLDLKEIMRDNFSEYLRLFEEKVRKDLDIREIRLIFKDKNKT